MSEHYDQREALHEIRNMEARRKSKKIDPVVEARKIMKRNKRKVQAEGLRTLSKEQVIRLLLNEYDKVELLQDYLKDTITAYELRGKGVTGIAELNFAQEFQVRLPEIKKKLESEVLGE